MNRKIKELIPLFAIGVMVIGAIMLLMAMNSDEPVSKKNNGIKVKSENKIKINDVNEPVAVIDEEKEENEESEENEKVKTDTNTNTNTISLGDALKVETTSNTSKTKEDGKSVNTPSTTKPVTDTSGMRSYIESMVNDFIPANETKENKDNNEGFGVVEVVETKNPWDKSSETINTSTHFLTVSTKTKSNETKIETYNNITKTVNVGKYAVSTTKNNKIILANSSSVGNAISALDCGNVNILMTKDNYIYAFEQGGGIKKFRISNDKLEQVAKGYVAFAVKEVVFTEGYIYILSTEGTLYAYQEKEATFMQLGFVRETQAITDITSANGTRISVRCSSNNYSYTFDGINFKR